MSEEKTLHESWYAETGLGRILKGRTHVNLDTLDLAPILAALKTVAEPACQLAAWEDNGLIDNAGGTLIFQMNRQWKHLESVLVAAGFENPLLIFDANKPTAEQRKTVAFMLLEMVRRMKEGKYVLGTFDPQTFAKRMVLAVEMVQALTPSEPAPAGSTAPIPYHATAERSQEPTAVLDSEAEFLFRKKGQIWHVRFGQEHGDFPDHKAFNHISELLSKSYRPLSGLELKGTYDTNKAALTCQETLDREAVEKLKEATQDYLQRIEKARRENDTVTVSTLQSEFQAVIDQLKQAHGLGGRSRQLGPSGPETKAFDTVRHALKRCYDLLRRSGLPMLAEHLEKTIVQASPTFTYTPGYDPLHPEPAWQF
jgi:hypothetical protein